MLLHQPIRTKLKLGLGLMLVTVLALFGSAYYGLYAYRSLVHSLSLRSSELPLARKVSERVIELRIILCQAEERSDIPLDDLPNAKEAALRDARMLSDQFDSRLSLVVDAVDAYARQLDETPRDDALAAADVDRSERRTLVKIGALIDDLRRTNGHIFRMVGASEIAKLREQVERLQAESLALPAHLETQLEKFSDDVRSHYRTALAIAWMNVGVAIIMIVAAWRVFYKWFADPLHVLVQGSRRVAGGDFDHRIQLETGDEIAELATAMNAMTDRFREIRDDLDRQVQERTTQVVRSEQLASVGFLAAGVSHEINNPLASIALCSESLESRLSELVDNLGPGRAEEVQVVRHYLQMIQREAFRCKQITEKLLDFARRGDSQRHATELRDLVAGVIDMVQHLGQFQDRRLELLPGLPVIASVNAQEIKQVVLNLVTNALESLDAGGSVRVAVERSGDWARIVIEDDGCGMTDEVRKHLFEPFFTRRRTGQGTGLGLSITHRIVEEHRGRIDAASEGPGRGSRFVVTLPSPQENKETHHRYQAA